MKAECEIAVVGAGPGGIAAAVTAAEAGLRVCLIDDNPAPGGQIWRGCGHGSAPHAAGYLHWNSRLTATKTRILSGWQVIHAPDSNLLRLERQGEVLDLQFQKLILATGARERFLPFPGWTLPGVMGAGAAQAFMKSGFNPKGRRAIVAGSGPLLLAVAAGLKKKGAKLAGIYEQAPLAKLLAFSITLLQHPGKLLEGAVYKTQTLSTRYRTGCWAIRAEGRKQVERVYLTDGRKTWTEECDLLACGYNLVPNLELPRLLGCKVVDGFVQVDEMRRSTQDGIYCIGEITGIGGLDKALLEGQIAGWSAAGRNSQAAGLCKALPRQLRFARQLAQAFALREELKKLPGSETLLCRCEDVPCRDLQNLPSSRAARLYSRMGMGACQGRVCGAATEYLFGWKDSDARPPVFPVSMASLSADLREE